MLNNTIKVGFLLLCFCASIVEARANICPRFNELSEPQKNILYKSYEYGKIDDIGYSLAAIGWQESKAGKYLVNLGDPSFGVFAITIKTASKVEGISENSFEANVLAQRLMTDFDYSLKMARREMLYWLGYHKNDWGRSWASYNAGFNTSAGSSYSQDIASYVRELKICLPAYTAKQQKKKSETNFVSLFHKLLEKEGV